MKAEANTVVPALQTKAGTPILLTGKKAVRGVPKGKYLAQYWLIAFLLYKRSFTTFLLNLSPGFCERTVYFQDNKITDATLWGRKDYEL